MAKTAEATSPSLCKTGTSRGKKRIKPQVNRVSGSVLYSKYFSLSYLRINWQNTQEVHKGKCEHSLISGYSLLYPRDQAP